MSNSRGCMWPGMTNEWRGPPRSTEVKLSSVEVQMLCESDPTLASPTQILSSVSAEKGKRKTVQKYLQLLLLHQQKREWQQKFFRTIWAVSWENQHSGFRPGPTQTRLYSYRRWLEAWNFGLYYLCSKNKGCFFVFTYAKMLVFSWCSSFLGERIKLGAAWLSYSGLLISQWNSP